MQMIDDQVQSRRLERPRIAMARQLHLHRVFEFRKRILGGIQCENLIDVGVSYIISSDNLARGAGKVKPALGVSMLDPVLGYFTLKCSKSRRLQCSIIANRRIRDDIVVNSWKNTNERGTAIVGVELELESVRGIVMVWEIVQGTKHSLRLFVSGAVRNT